MLAGQSFSLPCSEVFPYPNNDQFIPKRKRKPAGTPDPDAEVVYLSPEMLMESDRYVCEICNQSFQREQNLQMHRRRHKVPWKLLKRPEKQEIKKRVYVCPEPTCLHHDPSHALGDLVGIKKHFRRKHSNFKQWVCEKCSKGYAVQSDYKAHTKICGTRGHSCDCGRVFSRVEAFIEHQDACNGHMRSNYVPSSAAGAGEGTSTHGKNNHLSHSPIFSPPPAAAAAPFLRSHPNFSNKKPAADHTHTTTTSTHGQKKNNLDIHDHLPSYEARVEKNIINNFSHNLELELFTSSCSLDNNTINLEDNNIVEEIPEEAFRLRVEAKEISRMAMEEKKFAEEKRKEAKCLIGLAMQEMNEAKRIKEETVAELHAANVLKECSTSKIIINNNSNINNNLLQVKCNSCRKDFLTLAQESFGEPNQDGNFNSNSNLMLWTRYP